MQKFSRLRLFKKKKSEKRIASERLLLRNFEIWKTELLLEDCWRVYRRRRRCLDLCLTAGKWLGETFWRRRRNMTLRWRTAVNKNEPREKTTQVGVTRWPSPWFHLNAKPNLKFKKKTIPVCWEKKCMFEYDVGILNDTVMQNKYTTLNLF